MTGRIVPLTPELLQLAMATSREQQWRGAAEGAAFAAKVLQSELAFAMIDGGRILGCGGIAPEWHGRALVWMIVTVFARPRDVVAGIKIARRLFLQTQRDPAFRRLELLVRAGRSWCDSFSRALGFTLEGRCVAFGPDGDDYLMYARVVLPNG